MAAFAFWPLEGVKRCDDVLLPRIPFVFWFVSERGLVRELSLHLSRVFLEVVEMDDMCKQRAPRPTPSVWAVGGAQGTRSRWRPKTLFPLQVLCLVLVKAKSWLQMIAMTNNLSARNDRNND